VTLHYSTATNELISFSVRPTTPNTHYTYRKNPDSPTPGIEDGEKIVRQFGTPTKTAKSLYYDARQKIKNVLETATSDTCEIKIDGYGIFKCGRMPDAWGNTSYWGSRVNRK